MQKIALVYSHKPSEWVSCQKIVTNLAKSYISAFGKNVLHVSFNGNMSSAEILKSANMILEFNPTHVVFIDHKPHPLPLLNLILKSPHKTAKFKIIFHIFGDFCINLGD
jgi:hypothetical protein